MNDRSKLLWFLPCLLVGCGSTRPPLPPTPTHREPSKGAKVYAPAGPWTINNEADLAPLLKKTGATFNKVNRTLVVDLKGAILDGKNQAGDGGQSENQEPLFRARVPLVVKNGFVRNNKDALTFFAPNSGVERLTWLNVGEDAVATGDGAKNFVVRNCEFLNSKKGDKTVQLNDAAGAEVIGNLIYGGVTGVRIGKVAYTSSSAVASGGSNKFVGVDTAWNVGKMTLNVVTPNKYVNVRLPFKATNGAKIVNADGKIERN